MTWIRATAPTPADDRLAALHARIASASTSGGVAELWRASGLDPAGRLAVKAVLARLHASGRTLFFTSHVLSDVEELCSTIAVLDGGRLRFRGAPAELRGRTGEDNLERAFLKCVRSDADAPAIRA